MTIPKKNKRLKGCVNWWEVEMGSKHANKALDKREAEDDIRKEIEDVQNESGTQALSEEGEAQSKVDDEIHVGVL